MRNLSLGLTLTLLSGCGLFGGTGTDSADTDTDTDSDTDSDSDTDTDTDSDSDTDTDTDTDVDALTLEISNYSGERLNYVLAYDHSADEWYDLLGADVLNDGDSATWELDDGVWSFYGIDGDYLCAAAEEVELQDDQGGYFWKITSLDYDCSSFF